MMRSIKRTMAFIVTSVLCVAALLGSGSVAEAAAARDADGGTTGIPVSVNWLDGGDTDSRPAVEVMLYAKRALWFDGRLAFDKDQAIVSITLDADNSWQGEFPIPVTSYDIASDFYIAEESTYYGYGDTQGCYRVISWRDAVEDPAYESLRLNWPAYDTTPRMVSADPNQGTAYRVACSFDSAAGSFEVTNRRIGYTEAAIGRTWLDEGANASARPESTFTLVSPRSDITFTYDGSYSLNVNIPGMESAALYRRDASGRLVPLVRNVDVEVSGDGRTLTTDATAAGGASLFSIVNLPKYDAQGAVINWKVEESWAGEHGDYTLGDCTEAEGASSPWHQADVHAFSFANRREGTKSATFHVKWFDHYVKDELDARPDAALELYRQVFEYDADGNLTGASHLEAVPAADYGGTPTWSASDPTDRVANDSTGDYTQYATFANLPKYDDHGKMCVYYARTGVDGVTGTRDAITYRYAVSVSQDSYATDPGSWGAVDAEVAPADAEAAIDGATTAYREDSTFNCCISGAVTIAGQKIWDNVPAGYSDDDLPQVSVYVQRRMLAGSYDAAGAWTQAVTPWSRLALTQDASAQKGYTVKSSTASDIADGKTAVAWTNAFEKDGRNWSFAIDSRGDNAQGAGDELDAFDAEGRRYEYRVREVIDGLVGSSALDTDALFDSATADTLETAFGKVYEVSYTDYSITNTYACPQGTLTLRTAFAGRADDAKYPAVTFKLYRYYAGATGASPLEPVGEKTLTAAEAAAGTVTFDGLDVYTPLGLLWRYVVVEVAPDGYTAQSGAGELGASDSGFKDSATWAAANGVVLPEGATAAWMMGPAVELTEDGVAPSVTFRNEYVPGTAALAGEVRWADEGNAHGTRPDEVTLRLTRAYQDGTSAGDVTLQSDDPDAPNYFGWIECPLTDGDTWTYEVRNLDMYAPDGMPWKYTVTEDAFDAHYTIAFDGEGDGSCDATAGELPAIVNTYRVEDVPVSPTDPKDPGAGAGGQPAASAAGKHTAASAAGKRAGIPATGDEAPALYGALAALGLAVLALGARFARSKRSR